MKHKNASLAQYKQHMGADRTVHDTHHITLKLTVEFFIKNESRDARAKWAAIGEAVLETKDQQAFVRCEPEDEFWELEYYNSRTGDRHQRPWPHRH